MANRQVNEQFIGVDGFVDDDMYFPAGDNFFGADGTEAAPMAAPAAQSALTRSQHPAASAGLPGPEPPAARRALPGVLLQPPQPPLLPLRLLLQVSQRLMV